MAPDTTPHPVILTGPTSSGKTAVSLHLSRLLPVRIISADSMQVYRRMDIGTAKPTPQERAQIIHYGLDVLEPNRCYSVAEFTALAAAAVQETLAAGEWPVIVGGTRLYLYGLTRPFRGGSPPDEEQRARLTQEAAERGPEALHSELRQVDPDAAARVAPRDIKRVIRALEVYHSTGKTISQMQAESRQAEPLLQASSFALVRDRDALYAGVHARTAAMLSGGWIEEVATLLRDDFGPGLELIKAHGYRELAAYLRGEQSLTTAESAINQNVRNYVRYQLGWIRSSPEMKVLDAAQQPDQLAEQIREVLVNR